MQFVDDRFVIDPTKAVVVHCLAGCGRTGTMLACYLVAQGMDPAIAINHIRKLRPCSIESGYQEALIFQFGSTNG